MTVAASALAYACALRLAAGAVGEYETSVRIEGVARRGTVATSQLRLDPSARLSLRGGRFQAGLSYAPTAVLDGDAPGEPAILHSAALSAGWSGLRNLKLEVAAQGSYGENEFLSAPPPASEGETGSTPLQPIPSVTTLPFVSADVALRMEAVLGRRQTGRLEVAGFTSGGTTPEARSVLPTQRGARVGVGHAWALSPRNSLATDLSGAVTEFPDGPRTAIGNATLTWRHAILPGGQVWIGAGAATTSEVSPGGSPIDRILPSAVAGLVHPLDRRSLTGSVVLQLAPVTDRLTGTAHQRLDLTTSLQMRPGRRWGLSATASGGLQVSEGTRGDVVAIGDLRATYVPARWMDLAAGVRGLWQRPAQDDAGLATQPVRELGFFLSVSARRDGRL